MNELHVRLAALLRVALETKLTGEVPSELKEALAALPEDQREAVMNLVAGVEPAAEPPPVAA